MKSQLLVMCYNSRDCIKDTLDSWAPYIDRVCVFVNGGLDDDYSQVKETVDIINLVKIPSKMIFTGKFEGFSKSRNTLLDLASKDFDGYSIFIDDSYRLVRWVKPSDHQALQYTINCLGRRYPSVRIISSDSKIRYLGDIHETLNTNLRVLSGIEVEDIVYESHIQRTYSRAHYQLKVLECDNSPRGLYYKACAMISLYKQNKATKAEALAYLYRRREAKSSNSFENLLTELYIEELNK